MPVVHARKHGRNHPRVSPYHLDVRPEGPPPSVDTPEQLFTSQNSISSTSEFGHESLVYGTGVFLVLLLAYFSRRPLRSAVSRIAHGTATSFIHVHLHHSTTTTVMTTTAQYSPLPLLVHTEDDYPQEQPSASLIFSPSRDDPAPPYSPCVVPTSPSNNSIRHAAAGNPGPRECPAPTPLVSYQNPVLIPSVNTASEAGWTTSRTPVHHRPPPISIRSTDLPNYLLQTDSPCATPPPQYSSRSSSPKLSSAGSSRSGSDGGGVDASSFNGGSVPQYSITIYSSPRSLVHTCDVRGQSVEIHVPDIVLSPVPWLPSSDTYPMSSADRARQSSVHCAPMARGGQRPVPGCVSPGLGSPPGYLEVPSRKSRSRRHAAKEKEKERGLVMMRPAPAVPRVAAAAAARERDPPSENEYRRDHASWSKELEKKQRRMFTTPATSAPLTFPIGESVKPPPVPPKSPARMTTITTGSVSMQRCHSLPLAASTSRDAKMRESGLLIRSRSSHSISPPPPPQPVLPLDLEPVYPLEHLSTLGESEGGGVTSPVSYADEKGHAVDEKKGMVAMDRESEEEDMPLSKSLLLAMRKKTEELKGFKTGGGMRPAAGSNMSNSGEEKRLSSSLVTNMVKMQIFGRLGALAVRAKLAIERELDSDGDEDEDEEEGDGEDATRWEIADQKEKQVMVNASHAQFLSRENAFVIGDEEE